MLYDVLLLIAVRVLVTCLPDFFIVLLELGRDSSPGTPHSYYDLYCLLYCVLGGGGQLRSLPLSAPGVCRMEGGVQPPA